MTKPQVIDNIKDFVKEKLEGESSGHDWRHICRVWKTAKNIAQHEDADIYIVELAALLHDIADYKLNGGDENKGLEIVKNCLYNQEIYKDDIDHILYIIKNMSFKGASNNTSHLFSMEGKIVQDADRLDAIGAIGIARTFAFGGSDGREIHNPETPIREYNSFEEYKNNKSPTVNHFYEKLLLLKDRMNTNTARKIAEDRHQYMQEFLERFYKEWDGTL